MTRAGKQLIEAAARIGERLCSAAYWHESRCNWVGRSPRESPGPGIPLVPTVTALGPELYTGTAGIALFLSQLYSRTGIESLRRTAQGAMRQSFWRSEDVPSKMTGSFYSGLVGMAYSSVRVGQLLDDAQLIENGIELAHRAVRTPNSSGPLDVIGGNAGAIAPLLWLMKTPGCEGLQGPLQDLAAELASEATKRDDKWCWDNDRACGEGMGATPLCGFAHGASGMGLALMQMGVRYGHQEWIDGGLAAFRYEDEHYDVNRRNWPDLREFASSHDEPDGPKRYSWMVAWCHGAAGIGLARLKASQLLPERRKQLLTGANHAVAATVEHLQTLPADCDATFCHGRAGLADTLLYASAALNDRKHSDHVLQMWTRIVRTCGRENQWRVGVASGRNNPSLMLGQAGIGYALLRAVNPDAVPSILIIEPDRQPVDS